MAGRSLTIFFPCYNEEDDVAKSVEAAIEAAQLVTDDYEVIVVNDGCRDNTGQIAEEIADRIGIIHKGNLIALGTVDEIRAVDSGNLEDVFLEITAEEPEIAPDVFEA